MDLILWNSKSVNTWALAVLGKGYKNLTSYSCFLIKHLSILPDKKGGNDVLISNIWFRVKACSVIMPGKVRKF